MWGYHSNGELKQMEVYHNTPKSFYKNIFWVPIQMQRNHWSTATWVFSRGRQRFPSPNYVSNLEQAPQIVEISGAVPSWSLWAAPEPTSILMRERSSGLSMFVLPKYFLHLRFDTFLLQEVAKVIAYWFPCS